MKKITNKFLKASLAIAVSSTLCLTSNAANFDNEPRFLDEPIVLPNHQATKTPTSPLLNQNKEAVKFSWKIDSGFVPSPSNVLSSTSESVEYWQNITGAELNKGLEIATAAPGALVRISEKAGPSQIGRAQKALKGIEPLALEVITPNGKKMANGSAMALKASPQTLRDAGSPFPNGTTGFQLKESLGHGKFTLRNAKAMSPSTEYVMHVFDKYSSKRLSVTREQSSYKVGDTLSLHGDLTNNYKGMKINSLKGFVMSPSGDVMPLAVQKGVDGQFRADLALTQKAEYGGLYEAYIDASSLENGHEIKRRVKTAFAITNPTASMRTVSGTLEFGLPVSINVREAGRYEVRGVLYGTNAQGKLTPFMASSSAQWLNQGKRGLNLEFDQSIIAASGLSAPYEVQHLQLFDQSRMGSLQLMTKAVGISGHARTAVPVTAPSRPIAAPNDHPARSALKGMQEDDLNTTATKSRDDRIREFLK